MQTKIVKEEVSSSITLMKTKQGNLLIDDTTEMVVLDKEEIKALINFLEKEFLGQ